VSAYPSMAPLPICGSHSVNTRPTRDKTWTPIQRPTSGGFTAEILERVTSLHRRVLDAGAVERNAERKKSLLVFAENLERAFYGFEADFFQQNVSRIVDDVVSQIQGALELWPTLVEICYFQRHTKDLPKVKVANVTFGSG
jgi:hypothetical protein